MLIKNFQALKNFVPNRFSVVVPSFQQGKYLERTLLSILNQRNVDLEIIVQDGGSSDESIDILKKYSDRITWTSKKDAGQSSAINSGFHKATGEFLCYLNSDDIFYPNALKNVFLRFKAHPEIEVIYGRVDFIDEKDRVAGEYETHAWDYNELCEACIVSQPACFWKRSVMEKYGFFDEKLHYAMDYEYWLRIGRTTRFHYLAEKLAAARRHPESKTEAKREEAQCEIILVLKKYRNGSVPFRWIRSLAKSRASKHLSLETPGWLRWTRFAFSYWWNLFFLHSTIKAVPRSRILTQIAPPYPNALQHYLLYHPRKKECPFRRE